MSSKIIKILSVLAILALGLGLCACAGKDEGESAPKKIEYSAEFRNIDVDVKNGYVSAQKILGDYLYAISVEYDPKTYDTLSQDLHKINLITLEDNSLPMEMSEGDNYLINLNVMEDGSFITVSEDFGRDDGQAYFYIRKYSPDGKIVKEFDITEAIGEGSYVQDALFDKEDNAYIHVEDSVIVISGEGKKLFSASSGDWIDNIFAGKDGSIYAKYRNHENWTAVLKKVDLNKKGFGEEINNLPLDGAIVDAGNGKYISLTSNGAFEVDPATSEKTFLFNWLDVDISQFSQESFSVRDDGSYMMAQQIWEDGNDKPRFEVVTIKKGEPSDQKQLVTLGCVQLNWQLKEHILKFNKRNPDYRITVKVYSDEVDNYQTAYERFSNDLAKGKAFDIADLSYQSNLLYNIAGNGAFEDLSRYMDRDLVYEDYFMNAIKAYEMGGKVYGVCPSAVINALLVPKEEMDGIEKWDLDALLSLRQKYIDKPFLQYGTSEMALYSFLSYYMGDFVDAEKGTCDFENEEFTKLLKFCATFPKEIDGDYDDWESIQSGDTVLLQGRLSDVEEIEIYKTLAGGDLKIVGFPTPDGGGFGLESGMLLAICSKTKNAEGAWTFIKSTLEEDYQRKISYNGFPVLRSAFNDMMEEEMKTETYIDENGEVQLQSQGGWGNGNIMIEYYGASQDTVDQIRAAYESAKVIEGFDDKVLEIISEETGAFFEGQKSAEDVEAIIQSRVKIYLAEQK